MSTLVHLDEVRAELKSSRICIEDSRRCLADLHARLAGERNLTVMLEAAMRATRADFGNLQLLNPRTGCLEIVARRGFEGEFLEFFAEVHDDHGACGRAMALSQRVIVNDVLDHPIFAADDLRRIMARAKVRAVQSTPLVGRYGNLIGVVSTHFRQPRSFEAYELQMVDLLSKQAVYFVEYHGLRKLLAARDLLRPDAERKERGSPRRVFEHR